MKPSRLVALLLASTLIVLAACGNGSSAADGGGPGSTATQDEPSAAQGSQDGEGAASAPLASASDSPAAAGSGLTEPPGPADRTPFDDFGEVAIAIVATDGTVAGWCALLAETAEQRSQGLMRVTDLGGYVGMLFVHEQEQALKYWMKDTPMPLSIAWFDNQGMFVSSADMEPFDEVCEHCRSAGPARFSLEVPQGELPGVGVGAGSQLQVGGACA